MLPDGRRLHLQDGPIDLIVEAAGAPAAIADAYRAAAAAVSLRARRALRRTRGAAQRPRRQRRGPSMAPSRGGWRRRSRRMQADAFITPMAAVAGAVADEILAAMRRAIGDGLARVSVNNGGDIALWLAPGEATTVGLVSRPDRPALFARVRSRGGRRDRRRSPLPARRAAASRSASRTRSPSLRLARRRPTRPLPSSPTRSTFPGDARVERRPARSLQPDSDLGDRLVTRGVAPARPGFDRARRLTAASRRLGRSSPAGWSSPPRSICKASRAP